MEELPRNVPRFKLDGSICTDLENPQDQYGSDDDGEPVEAPELDKSRESPPSDGSADGMPITRIPTQMGKSMTSFVRTLTSKRSTDAGTQQPSVRTQPSSRSRVSVHSFAKGSAPGIRQVVTDLVTFDGCDNMLRSIRLDRVLRGGAALLAQQRVEGTYELSVPCDDIGTFLSHNWVVPRWAKYCVLVFHYNFTAAAVAMLSAQLLCCGASILGWLPLVPDVAIASLGGPPRLAVGSKLSALPVFLLTLFFFRSVTRLLGIKSPTLFIDKACIHQTDKTIQQIGIRKLAAFLGKSRQMLVVYSDVYLTKLWTIYEVASFLVLHPLEDLIVMPVWQPMVLLVGVVSAVMLGIVAIPVRAFSPDYHYVQITWCVLMYVMWFITCRRWARSRKAMQERLENFTVRDAVCFDEADRPLVYTNIVSLLIAAGDVAEDTSLGAALESFDELVRSRLPAAFRFLRRGHALEFRHYLLLGWVGGGGPMLDYIAALAQTGASAQTMVSYTAYFLIHVLVLWPTAALLGEFFAARRLRWSRSSPQLYVWWLVSFFLSLVPVFAVDSVLLWDLMLSAHTSAASLAALITVATVGALIVWLVTTERCPCCRVRGAALPAAPSRNLAAEQSERACQIGESLPSSFALEMRWAAQERARRNNSGSDGVHAKGSGSDETTCPTFEGDDALSDVTAYSV